MRRISIPLVAILVLVPWIALAQTSAIEGPKQEKTATDSSRARQPYDMSKRVYREVDDFEGSYGHSRPKFPSQEEIARIKSPQEAMSFPGISIYFGGAVSYRDNSDLDESFADAEMAFGTAYFNRFAGSRASFTLGLRWRFSRPVGIMWEYVYGGTPQDNEFRVSSVTLSLLYTLFPEKMVSLSFGPGIGTQRIRARRDYYFSLGQGEILENIKFDTGQRQEIPLIALLEFRPSLTHPRYALFFSARYIIGPTVTETRTLGYNDYQTTIKIRMNGTRLTGGISIAI